MLLIDVVSKIKGLFLDREQKCCEEVFFSIFYFKEFTEKVMSSESFNDGKIVILVHVFGLF
jgi:hypothetical protein